MNTAINTQYKYDIVVIGSGPAGLAFCRSMANSGLSIAIVDPNSKETLSYPHVDGREVSIIKKSQHILTELGVWQLIEEKDKHPLKAAKVFNGESSYSLNFDLDKARGEKLGYFVPNNCIRKALFQKVCEQENITAFYKNKVAAIKNTSDSACVTLETGDSISARLVVSADSRYSELRKAMGIATNVYDFARTVIIFRMQHTKSNNHIATEHFHYKRTMAILPLGEYTSSIVITVDSKESDEVFNLNEADTCKDVMDSLRGQLGNMNVVSEKYRYPLISVHAQKFYATRYALIGDAAVGMHPVTAQGFNLGLQSQAILSDLLKEASHNGDDIGNHQLLEKYSRKHMATTLPLYHGTNAIVKLFTTENQISRPLRHLVLRVGNHFYPFKKYVNKRLTG